MFITSTLRANLSQGLCRSMASSDCYTRATMPALDDVRVLDLTRLLPGPFCTVLLADFGADVVKVEDTGGGDYMRWMPPLVDEYSAMFHPLNRNKRSLAIDLKNALGRQAFLRLVATADVVVESFRPGRDGSSRHRDGSAARGQSQARALQHQRLWPGWTVS